MEFNNFNWRFPGPDHCRQPEFMHRRFYDDIGRPHQVWRLSKEFPSNLIPHSSAITSYNNWEDSDIHHRDIARNPIDLGYPDCEQNGPFLIRRRMTHSDNIGFRRPILNDVSLMPEDNISDVINSLLYLGENIERICNTALSPPRDINNTQCGTLPVDFSLVEKQQDTIPNSSECRALKEDLKEAENDEAEADLNLNLTQNKDTFQDDPLVGSCVSEPPSSSVLPENLNDDVQLPTKPRSRLNSGLILLVPSENKVLQKKMTDTDEFYSRLDLHDSTFFSQSFSFRKRVSSLLGRGQTDTEKDPADSLFLIEQPAQRRRHTISIHSTTRGKFKLSSQLSNSQELTLAG